MRILVCCLLFFCAISVQGQEVQDAGVLIGMSYAYQRPGGDLADRFGPNFSAGLSASYIGKESAFLFGLDGYFLFGDQVRTDVLAPLRTPEGFIIANDKRIANVLLRQRGFYLGAHVGRIFGLLADNARSGLRVTLGAGLLQHRIRIQDEPFRPVAALAGDYKKGYDRLTNGLALRQFIGYQHLAPDRRLNFFAGFEFLQGLTRNRRDFNFDTRTRDDRRRLDLLWGVRVGVTLPLYFSGEREIFY